MSGPDGGGSAFPWGNHGDRLGGMTMRQYYKAAALERLHIQIMREPWESQNQYLKNCADTCGMLADAMLAEDAAHAKETR